MPWRDGRGPSGRGSMSGRGQGPCGGSGLPDLLGRLGGSLALALVAWGGRALSRRLGPEVPGGSAPGPGRVAGGENPAALAAGPEADVAALRDRAEALERELAGVRRRILALDSPVRRALPKI